MVNKMTFSRIEETSADFSNSNRGDLINNDSNIFFNYPLLGAGYSNPIILGSNFFSIFARYGMIGAFFYYLVLFYLLVTLMRYNKFYYFKFFLVILIILVHRPEISNILTLLLLYCFIYFIEDKIAREKFTNFK